MENQKGMGLLGLLISVLIVALLLTVVLKRYTEQTRRTLHLPAVASPTSKKGKTVSSSGSQGVHSAGTSCNGRLVGNICVPTEVHSSSLDAFERMNK